MIGMLGVIAVLWPEAHEWAEAHWATSRRACLRRRATVTPHPGRCRSGAGAQRAAGDADRNTRCLAVLDHRTTKSSSSTTIRAMRLCGAVQEHCLLVSTTGFASST